MDEIDEHGGFMKCLESGWLWREARKGFDERYDRIERGEEIKVGLNKYVEEEEEVIPLFEYDPTVEERQKERLKKFKEERDEARAMAALNNLRAVAKQVNEKWPRGGDLMPAVIEAIRADATAGETIGVLREVFGYGFFYQ